MENKDNFSFKVGQTLHGYRDGHRLLLSSIQLDEFSTIEMARMSDLMPKRLGTEGYYFCAYPLKSINKYVLSCTWPAIEMPRPGCVWTHSLIFDYATVAKLSSLESFLACFQKPGIIEIQDFTSDLWMNESEPKGRRRLEWKLSNDTDEPLLRRALKQVYYNSVSKIILPAAQFNAGRSMIPFLIWNQMPPRLRRDFVFCTSGNARSQLPQALVAMVISEDEDSAYENEDSFPMIGLDALVADSLLNRRSELRAFVARYVTDISDARMGIPKLVDIGVSLLANGPELGLRSAAIRVAEYFGSGDEANLLKKELTCGLLLDSRLYAEDDQFSLLLKNVLPVFFRLQRPLEGELVNLFLDKYVFSNIENNINRVVGIIQAAWDSSNNSFGRELLSNLVTRSGPSLIGPLKLRAEIKLCLASLDNRLLHETTFWQNFETEPTFDDWETLNSIGTLELLVSGLLVGKMYAPVLALIRENTENSLPHIVQFLVNVDSKNRKMMLSEFRSERIKFVRHLANSNNSELQILQELTEDIFYFPNPYIRPEEWVRILRNEQAIEFISPYWAYVMFDQANTTDQATAANLYFFSFSILHSVELNFDDASRNVTKRIYQSYSRDYNNQYTDAANRIRKRFCDFFQDYRDYSAFLKCTTNDKTLILLFETMIGSWRGREWLQGLAEAENRGEISLSITQKAILAKFVEKRRTGPLGLW